MHQKRKIVVWRFMALLSVLSIGISLLVMSSMLTYAAPPNQDLPAALLIWRIPGSKVNSVRIKSTSDPSDTSDGKGICQQISNDTTLTMVIASDKRTFRKGDIITLVDFFDTNCKTPTGKQFTFSIDNLPPESNTRNGRVYTIFP